MNFNCGSEQYARQIIKDLWHEILEGSFKNRFYCFTAFKQEGYAMNIVINITRKVKIQVYNNNDFPFWINCRIFTENEDSQVEITEEDLLTINDIMLFLKTKAEESKKEYDADMERAEK